MGLAILGSVMNNRFASELITRIPSSVKAQVPTGQLASLTNPQALVNPQVQAQLQGTLAKMGPQGQTILGQILLALKGALASAIAECFLIAMVIIIIALGVTLFLKEIPLRKHHAGESKSEAKPVRETM